MYFFFFTNVMIYFKILLHCFSEHLVLPVKAFDQFPALLKQMLRNEIFSCSLEMMRNGNLHNIGGSLRCSCCPVLCHMWDDTGFCYRRIPNKTFL